MSNFVDPFGAAAAFAFSEGSDSRLAGLPPSANPYHAEVDQELRRAWDRGWLDVHRGWATFPRIRWAVRPLPPVMGRVSA